MKIVFAVNEFDANFVCKQNCVGTIGFSLIKKCTAYLKMLAYGAHDDTHDDYLSMAESTAIECMYRFSADGGRGWRIIRENTRCKRRCPDYGT
jgi:hypothetical protein